MIKKLIQIGFFLGGFASFSSWAISIVDADAGAYDGTNVGVVDTFLAEAAKAGNPTAETAWVNGYLGTTGVAVEFTVKTEDISYFSTDATNIFAFKLASPAPDYFLVKNAKRMALFENLADVSWGVFSTDNLSLAMKLSGSEYEISHVTQLNSTAAVTVPEPGMVGLLAIGLLCVTVARRKMII